MQKALIALATTAALLAAGTATAQVGKAASEATDAVQHKIDEKRADSDAKNSGPVGKARLQAFPRVTLCMPCKARAERR